MHSKFIQRLYTFALVTLASTSVAHAKTTSKGLNFDGLKDLILASVNSAVVAGVAIVTAGIALAFLWYAAVLLSSGQWKGAQLGRILVSAVIAILVSSGTVALLFA